MSSLHWLVLLDISTRRMLLLWGHARCGLWQRVQRRRWGHGSSMIGLGSWYWQAALRFLRLKGCRASGLTTGSLVRASDSACSPSFKGPESSGFHGSIFQGSRWAPMSLHHRNGCSHNGRIRMWSKLSLIWPIIVRIFWWSIHGREP